MHRVLSSRWLNNALNLAERPAGLELPVFLCPTAIKIRNSYIPRSRVPPRLQNTPWRTQRRCLHVQAEPSTTLTTSSTTLTTSSDSIPDASPPTKKLLPRQCRGCGALSQTSHPNQPGYFDLNRKAVQKYLGALQTRSHPRRAEKLYEDVLRKLDSEALKKQGVDLEALGLIPPEETRPETPPKQPLCDRCHFLLHNHSGESIYHPSLDSILDTLLESPYKYNHVYHVLDAADFPMSILPKISELLSTMPLRSRNRRSRAGRYYHGQKTEISFIISRSDLLAPTKEQVDKLFPYLREVLRDTLGRFGEGIRLGNLMAVSAARGWWTKDLKEDIWRRGGAGWMVGKANVGKSQLFEAVFPKGRMNWQPSEHQIAVHMEPKKAVLTPAAQTRQSRDGTTPDDIMYANEDESMDTYSLLPPAPMETQYPEMPIVSDLPGTTASPIRVPFGNGRGELIDLPGLDRSGLEQHIQKEHRLSLVMRSRIVPEQITIKPGQSLLLGGFIRITPREPCPVLLTYTFAPIEPHVCRTDKAISIQNQTGEIQVENIAVPGTGDKTKLAGSFELKWDVTKERTGPLTRRDAIGLDVDVLPYRVLAADILIEGVGWLEVVAQVRTRDLYRQRLPSEGEKQEANPVPAEKSTAMERIIDAMAEDQPKKQVDAAPVAKPTAMERFDAMAEDQPKKQADAAPVAKLTSMERFEAMADDRPKRRADAAPVAKLTAMERFEAMADDRPKKRVDYAPVAKLTAMERFEAMAEDRPKKRVDYAPVAKLPAMERFEAMAEDRSKTSIREPAVIPPKPYDEPDWPIVDVYSPEGKYIAVRRPMNGWMLNKPLKTVASRRGRPRKSMKGAKKLEKKLKHEREGQGSFDREFQKARV